MKGLVMTALPKRVGSFRVHEKTSGHITEVLVNGDRLQLFNFAQTSDLLLSHSLVFSLVLVYTLYLSSAIQPSKPGFRLVYKAGNCNRRMSHSLLSFSKLTLRFLGLPTPDTRLPFLVTLTSTTHYKLT